MRVLLVFVGLTACGDNIAGVTIDDYADARRTADCERLTRCGLFSNFDACERFLSDRLDHDVRAAIDANKIAYDGSAAKACLAAVAEQSCDATSEDARALIPACERLFTGLVADGAECAFDLECASGACDAPACPIDECCPGTCLATITNAATDEGCHRDRDCTDGYCGTDALCHARGAARDMCTRDEECGFDLACIGATELQPGLCRDLPAIDEACPYMRCADIGAMCVAGTCKPVGLASAPCMTGADCSPYGECNASGECAELPTLGQACSVGCARDAWCDNGQCAALLPNTTPCSAGNQCESLYCDEGDVFDACADRITCL